MHHHHDSGLFYLTSKQLITDNAISLEVAVASELIHDMNGEISLTNAIDRKGDLIGKKIKLLFYKSSKTKNSITL